jgi:hypothetical protein
MQVNASELSWGPDLAATRWYMLELSVPDDCPSFVVSPTSHRQTAERFCLG